MGRAPNQKHVVYHRPQYKSGFTLVSKEGWQTVAKKYKSRAVLILYLYMVDNKDGYEEDLSTSYLSNLFGMDRKTWQRAIDVLIDEGYLVHRVGEADNNFDFYPTPQIVASQNVASQIVDIDCKLIEFARLNDSEQKKMYEAILKLDWDDMTEEQVKIHDFYVENVLGD